MGTSKAKSQPKSFNKLKLCVLAISCMVLTFSVYLVKYHNYGENLKHTNKNLSYWIQYELSPKTLKNVKIVMNLFGWQENKNVEECDLLWFHDYPFEKYSTEIKQLKEHQRVNHFPGGVWITNKALMAQSVQSEYIPKAFYPYADKADMAEYIQANPNKKFVQKSIYNRKIKLISIKDFDMNARDMFIQEFVENPLLIDGYKFDLGLWVVLTSIDPLRLYVYDGQMLIRLCLEKYHPFNAEIVNKYVVSHQYRLAETLPMFGKHTNVTKSGTKGAFEAVLQYMGHDPNKLFEQMDKIIIDVFTQQEKYLIEETQNFPNKKNFFELVRFDFIVDDNLKVHLMEINMSPQMRIPKRQKIYYDVMNLVGISKSIEEQLSGDDEIMVDPYVCGFPPCSESCDSPECSLCGSCLSEENKEELQTAFREHVNRRLFRRLIPSSLHYNEDAMEKMSPKNKMMTKWFKKKCEKSVGWC